MAKPPPPGNEPQIRSTPRPPRRLLQGGPGRHKEQTLPVLPRPAPGRGGVPEPPRPPPRADAAGPPPAFPETRVNQGTDVSSSGWPSCGARAGPGMEAGSRTPKFRTETHPLLPTLSPASQQTPPPPRPRSSPESGSNRAVAESRPNGPSPRPQTSPLSRAPRLWTAPDFRHSLLSLRTGGGGTGPPASATCPSPRARVLCPQIRAKGWSAALARPAAC